MRPPNEPLGEDHPLRPVSPYGLSKLAQELVGGGNPDGPQVYIARPFNHFGPRQDFQFVTSAFARRSPTSRPAAATGTIEVGNLDAERDLTDVRDTVRAYRLILEHGIVGRPYNVCSGTAVSIRRAARPAARPGPRSDPGRRRSGTLPAERSAAWWSVTRPASAASLAGRPVIPLERTLDDVLEYWRTR